MLRVRRASRFFPFLALLPAASLSAQPAAPAEVATAGASAAEPELAASWEGAPDPHGNRTLVLRRGHLQASSRLAASAAASVRTLPLSTDARVDQGFVVRVDDAGTARFLIVTTHPQLRVLATLGPVVADREHAAELEVRGGATPIVSILSSFGDACGAHQARLDAHRIEGGRALRGEALVPLEATSSIEAVAPPEGSDRPFLAAQEGFTRAGPTSGGLAALVDGDATTAWPREPSPARLHVRYTLAPLRIRGLRLLPIAGASGRRDVRIALGDRILDVHVPAGQGPVLVPIEPPLDARCVAIDLGEHGASAIAELGFVPELVGDEARANRLATELVGEGARADAAIAAIVELGAAGLAVLESTFPDATPTERRRILRAAEALVAREPNALRLFVLAIESGDEELAQQAIARCLALGAPGHRALAVALRRGRPEVARALAERAPASAFDPILERLATSEDLDERRLLHEALAIATRRAPDRGPAALRAFVTGEADPSARAIALAVLGELRDAASIREVFDAFASATADTDRVDVLVRSLEAIAVVPAAERSAAMQGLLVRAFAHEAWMVRRAAVLAADPSLLAQTRAALADEVPRVRVAAIRALAEDADSRRRIGELAHGDEWPIVRLAGLVQIAPIPEAEPLLRAALQDRATRVRIGVLETLEARNDRRFAADVIGIVERNRAPTNVVLAAIHYLGATCARPAEAALLAHVDRALAEVSERNRTLGEAAARAIERLGSEDAVRSARRLADPTVAGARAPARCPE